jgi:hypothetical protein
MIIAIDGTELGSNFLKTGIGLGIAIFAITNGITKKSRNQKEYYRALSLTSK